MDVKTVLCCGDSNTYGYDPSNGLRYPEGIRWTSRLAGLLGDEYWVIEEGCNGRNTVYDDPIDGWKNGLNYLRPCLNSHKPVDIITLMLGSNDLKDVFHASAKEIAEGAGVLVDVIRTFTEEKQGFIPHIILISPPEIGEDITHSSFYGRFREDAVDRSREFPGYYRDIAERYGCLFLDAALLVKPSPIDSLHLSPESHEKLAEKIAEVILGIKD